MTTQDYIQDQFKGFINKGGIQVSDEQMQERLNVCSGCPFNGMVEPDPLIGEMPGCTAPGCQCPFSTKAKMLKYWRKKGKENESLTAMELIEVRMLKNIIPDRYELVTIKCVHPEGNKWESVDEKYK